MPAEEEVTIPAITVEQAALSYKNTIIFKDINLQLPAGEWVALLGPSGVGKSSLLKLLAHLNTDQATLSGCVSTDNAIPAAEQIAYMAQSDLLLPWLTALDNACLGARLRGTHRDKKRQCRTQAADLLTRAGLSHALHLYPHELSGGMRQRVALVRTLMEAKPVVLMDEPFSALDAITRHQLQNLAADMLTGKTVLFITHDPAEAIRLAHHLYIMQGRPATLNKVAELKTATPRDSCHPDNITIQAALLKALTTAAGEV